MAHWVICVFSLAYKKNHIINSQINILKFVLFFINTYFELFNNDELKELYKRFSLLQTEFNNYNDIFFFTKISFN